VLTAKALESSRKEKRGGTRSRRRVSFPMRFSRSTGGDSVSPTTLEKYLLALFAEPQRPKLFPRLRGLSLPLWVGRYASASLAHTTRVFPEAARVGNSATIIERLRRPGTGTGSFSVVESGSQLNRVITPTLFSVPPEPFRWHLPPAAPSPCTRPHSDAARRRRVPSSEIPCHPPWR
jgi:hypothetical protein